SRRAETYPQLRVDRGTVQKREVPVGRGRGKDLDVPAAREIGERTDEIPPESMEVRLAEPPVRPEIEVGESRTPGVARRDEAAHVLFGASDLIVDVLDVPDPDIVICELLEQHRRQAHDDPIPDAG